MTSPEERTLTPLSPRELLLGELPAVLSRWQRSPTSDTARVLLALWAGLQRLDQGEPDPDEERLNALVSTEGLHLGRLARRPGPRPSSAGAAE